MPIRSLAAETAADSVVTPEQALEQLKQGNLRYVEGIKKYPKSDPVRRLRTATEGQEPIATVLGCSDSRAPVEATFDKRFGDLFVIRVAGNVCYMAELASIEYGVNYLKTPLVVVLGHTKCGAVDATISRKQLSGSLPKLVNEIQPAVDAVLQQQPELKGEELLNASIKQNVWKSIEDLFNGSELIGQAAREKRIIVVGAVRDIATGRVTWLGPHPQQSRLTGSP